ncbi:ABC transporter permease subunit [Mycoplasma sp. 4013]
MTKKKFLVKVWQKTLTKWTLLITSLIILFIFIYQLNIKPSKIGLKLFWVNLKNLFEFSSNSPDFINENLWILNLKYMWITIKSVFSGTFVGLLLAFITAYFSSLNLWRKNWWTWIVRIAIILLRSMPILVPIMIFGSSYQKDMIAFMIFWYTTWLWLHRYFCDIFESSNTKKFWQDINLGMPRYKSFYINIVLSNKNKFIMNSLLAIESNIRWNSILGSVGIYGIGFVFNFFKEKIEYLGISILFVVILVGFFEGILILFNKFLFVSPKIKNPSEKTPYSLAYNYKKILKYLIFAVFFAIIITSFVDLSQTKVNIEFLKLWFNNLFIFDFSEVAIDPNIYNSYWSIFKQTYIAIYLAFLLAILYAILMSEKLFKPIQTYFFKLFIVLLKSIPVLIFFILFNSIFYFETAIILAVIIIAFRAMSKQFSEVINRIDESKVKHWRKLGYSRWFIYKNILLPMYKKAIISLLLFESEGTYRNFITYGVFSNIIIYTYISRYEEKQEFGKIIPAFLPAFFIYVLLELLFLLYKTFLLHKLWKWLCELVINIYKKLCKRFKKQVQTY